MRTKQKTSAQPVSLANFFRAVLKQLHAPATPANLTHLEAWAHAESGPTGFGAGRNNPLNSTFAAPGAGCFNSVCVRNYVSPAQGIQMTAATIRAYGGILRQFLSGKPKPLSGSALTNGSSSWQYSTYNAGFNTTPAHGKTTGATATGAAALAGTGAAAAGGSSKTCTCSGLNTINPFCYVGFVSCKAGLELGLIGRWLEAGAGGAVMFLGLAVTIYGASSSTRGIAKVGASVASGGTLAAAGGLLGSVGKGREQKRKRSEEKKPTRKPKSTPKSRSGPASGTQHAGESDQDYAKRRIREDPESVGYSRGGGE